jgi:Bifunctional DNA primase/polymerase, N-terminal
MSAPCAWTSALKLAQRGFPVFPCDETKRPLTPNGFKDASSDPNIVHAWWTEHPEALIGVPTGERFVVIDIDLQHADALRWLEQNRHRLPLTRTHTTRSGGKHYLFAPNDAIKCSTSKLGPHVDTRGTGGYIIWWPAHRFEVLHAKVLAPVPEWMLEALKPAPAPHLPAPVVMSPEFARRKLNGILRTIATARVGERNTVGFWGACRLAEMVRSGKLSRDEAIALTIEAASRTGLTRSEAEGRIKSAFRTIGI